MYKYYYCVTLAIYESIWVLSILTYLYSLMNLWSTKLSKKTIRTMKLEPIVILYFLEPLYFILSGYAFCSYWIKNTSVHISLCQWKMFAVSEFPKKDHSTIYILYTLVHIKIHVHFSPKFIIERTEKTTISHEVFL